MDDVGLVRTALSSLLAFPGAALFVLADSLALRAAELAVRHRLRGADAICGATAEREGAMLVTWDGEMRQRGAAVVVTRTPEEWLQEHTARSSCTEGSGVLRRKRHREARLGENSGPIVAYFALGYRDAVFWTHTCPACGISVH